MDVSNTNIEIEPACANCITGFNKFLRNETQAAFIASMQKELESNTDNFIFDPNTFRKLLIISGVLGPHLSSFQNLPKHSFKGCNFTVIRDELKKYDTSVEYNNQVIFDSKRFENLLISAGII